MKRNLTTTLIKWQQQKRRMPILLRGARQVGKSYIVEEFGRQHFQQLITINFELNPEFKDCFTSLEPSEIITKISALTKQRIDKANTLLFLDEIQECPEAIRSLRYFKEKCSELAVIGAGSLLELVLDNAKFRMPVGRVRDLVLRPLSFSEYLQATNEELILEMLQAATLDKPISNAVHHHLLKILKQYMTIGGMPESIANYIENNDLSACKDMQSSILKLYRADFGKYATNADLKYLQKIYDKAPGLVGTSFKYSKIDPDVQSRELKSALEKLQNARVLYKVPSSAASGLPLITTANDKKFKLLFLDIGLLQRSCNLDLQLLFDNDILLNNRGNLAEQFVGQELLTLEESEDQLFYWSRDKKNSSAEVDYLYTAKGIIYPIEVKAGATGRLKSLQIFKQEKQSPFGIRISEKPLQYDEKHGVLSVPLYMIAELNRLISEMLTA